MIVENKGKKYYKTEKVPLKVKNKSEKLITNEVFVAVYFG